MEAASLGLEVLFHTLQKGARVDVLAAVQMEVPQASLCTSLVHRQPFLTNARVDRNKPTIAILGGIIDMKDGHFWIRCDGKTLVFQHETPNCDAFTRLVEGCSGLGIVGEGFNTAGMETILYCDSNHNFCELLKKHTRKPVVHGDICHQHTVEKIAQIIDERSHILTAGIACQPFSSLGDMQQEKDSRSMSLVGVLRLGFYLRSVCIVLECTKEAMQSGWVQNILREFHGVTNYSVTQKVLSLHETWPAHRNRWWCIIMHPAFPMVELQDLPSHRFNPAINHVIPRTLPLTVGEALELELDDYEFDCFTNHKGGIPSFIIDLLKGLPTATHSWGSQAAACACGCRQEGFKRRRLADRGLHGVLTIVDHVDTDGTKFKPHRVRHLSAQEVILLNGGSPSGLTPLGQGESRLALAGAGQLASPIQATWVAASITHKVAQVFPEVPHMHPRHAVAEQCRQVLQDRSLHWTGPTTSIMDRFACEVQAIDHPMIYPRNADEEEDEPGQDAEHVMVPVTGLVESTSPPPRDPVLPDIKPAAVTGGIRGFENRKKPRQSSETTQPAQATALTWSDERVDEQSPVPAAETEHEHESLPIPSGVTETAHAQSKVTHKDSYACPRIRGHDTESEHAPTHKRSTHGKITCMIVHDEPPDVEVKIPRGTVVGNLVRTEVRFACPHDDQPRRHASIVGTMVNADEEIHEDKILVVSTNWETTECPLHAQHPKLPDLQGMFRWQALMRQKGWVAHDELIHYLRQLPIEPDQQVQSPMILPEGSTAIAIAIGDWIGERIEHAMNHGGPVTTFTVFWYRHHWFPVELHMKDEQIQIITTPDMSSKMQQWLTHAVGVEAQVNHRSVISQFAADCGFQAFAWIRLRMQGQETITPMTAAEAIAMRVEFAQELYHQQTLMPEHLILGGMNQDEMRKTLQDLVEQHGVNPARSPKCASHLIQAIGHAAIAKALGSARPWADLKTLASQNSPPIKIVLASELQDAIANRVKSGKPFGRKENKKQERAQKPPLSIRADQIRIPDSVFQADGQPIPQIHSHQANATCRGIMIMNKAEAKPYMEMTQPLSQNAVALLVLDIPDAATVRPHEVVQFPAEFIETSEPILVQAAMFQLGMKWVTRWKPPQCHRIEEEAMTVVRAQLYRDQTPLDWHTIAERPVKTLLAEGEFTSQGPGMIHDVWDRQFVSSRYTKTKPTEADIFIVTLRISDTLLPHVLAANATNGKYYEPRIPSGRQTAPEFEVVWTPKKNHNEMTLAKQTNPHDCWIVRAGARYGLRVAKEHAAATHAKQRPDLEYIPGSAMQSYRIGPLPFHTTKQSLSKAFKAWEWPARAGQPLGQDRLHRGVYWSAMSSEEPAHWAYQMEHGDVIIAAIQNPREKGPERPPITFEASPQTLKHVVASQRVKPVDKGEDPWAQQDPWMKETTPPRAISAQQLASIETSVQKKVMEALKDQKANQSDEEMEPVHDSKVAQLEHQMKQMQSNLDQVSHNMHTFQTQQTEHNRQVATEIGAVKHQVDIHQKGMQSFIEKKMEEQLGRIEDILSKRAKTSAE
eukprot:Skav230762  [mRNA]  locus=scaffold4515:157725:162575:+ [translate_table: standard]